MEKVTGRSRGGKSAALSCRICGCTEEKACRPFGCVWVTRRPTSAALCSACIFFLANLRSDVVAAAVCMAARIPLILPAEGARLLARSIVGMELGALVAGGTAGGSSSSSAKGNA